MRQKVQIAAALQWCLSGPRKQYFAMIALLQTSQKAFVESAG